MPVVCCRVTSRPRRAPTRRRCISRPPHTSVRRPGRPRRRPSTRGGSRRRGTSPPATAGRRLAGREDPAHLGHRPHHPPLELLGERDALLRAAGQHDHAVRRAYDVDLPLE
jgi:hypothetical protein